MYINVKMCLRYVHTGGAKCESVYLLEAPVFNYRTSYKGYFRILKGPKEILEGPKKQSSYLAANNLSPKQRVKKTLDYCFLDS